MRKASFGESRDPATSMQRYLAGDPGQKAEVNIYIGACPLSSLEGIQRGVCYAMGPTIITLERPDIVPAGRQQRSVRWELEERSQSPTPALGVNAVRHREAVATATSKGNVAPPGSNLQALVQLSARYGEIRHESVCAREAGACRVTLPRYIVGFTVVVVTTRPICPRGAVWLATH